MNAKIIFVVLGLAWVIMFYLNQQHFEEQKREAYKLGYQMGYDDGIRANSFAYEWGSSTNNFRTESE